MNCHGREGTGHNWLVPKAFTSFAENGTNKWTLSMAMKS